MIKEHRMGRHLLYTSVAIFFGLVAVIGCGPDSRAAEQIGVSAATPDIAKDTLPFLERPVTSTPLTEQATAAPSLFPTPPMLEDASTKVCLEPPRRFGFRQALGIERLAMLQFESEEIITFEGWTQRPEPVVTPITPEVTANGSPGPTNSYRILLTGGQLDLKKGQFGSQSLHVDDPIANPCGEVCPLEVIGQSPDSRWQLIQISDWLQEQMGIWLVSEETVTRLVSYVPSDPRWQWAADSSLLWLSYPDTDLGGYTLVAQLNEPPVIEIAEYGTMLDPFFYSLAYSPMDNTARSVPSFELGETRTEEVFTITLADGLEHVSAVQNVPGIVSVNWNEATQSFIAQIVTTEGILFQELLGELWVMIPHNTLKALLPNFTDVPSTLPYGISAVGDSAISKSGSRLALVHSPGEIWVFDCRVAH